MFPTKALSGCTTKDFSRLIWTPVQVFIASIGVIEIRNVPTKIRAVKEGNADISSRLVSIRTLFESANADRIFKEGRPLRYPEGHEPGNV